MVDVKKLLDKMYAEGIEFFAGVPDSYLNRFCECLVSSVPQEKHVIAANEGNAVAIASGYYFSTQTVPLVYMQNSGLGNALNPIVSLADKHVYRVPMVLMVGWRGQPGTGDWPQHTTQGEITTKLMDLLEIPCQVLKTTQEEIEQQISWAVKTAKDNCIPVALVVPKGVFSGDKKPIQDDSYPLNREEAIEVLLNQMPKDAIFVATTGRATRELYYLREKRQENHSLDFLNVGSMGHASSVALGLALANPHRQVVCLDGDAAALMHLGSFAMASTVNACNLLHVILNNGAHESVGGQPSVGQKVDFTMAAKAMGYQTTDMVPTTQQEIVDCLHKLEDRTKAGFMDIKIRKGMNGVVPPLKICHQTLIEEFENALKPQRTEG